MLLDRCLGDIDDILVEQIFLPVEFHSYISSLYSELVSFIEIKEWKTNKPFSDYPRGGGGSFKVTLCHLLSSWWPQYSPFSMFSLILPSFTNSGCLPDSQKGIPLYIPFGMSLNQKNLLDGTWTRSFTSRTMAMQSFATKEEALLKKHSTCSMSHGFKQRVIESGLFQFHQPLRLWSLHHKIPIVMSTLCERLC